MAKSACPFHPNFILINGKPRYRPAMDKSAQRIGVLQAVSAYCIWGFMPLFFKLFDGVSAWEVVAHRVI
jgi:hypothetical protein